MIDTGTNLALNEVKTEITNQLQGAGISFSIEQISGLNELIVISANYISADWKLTRRIIRLLFINLRYHTFKYNFIKILYFS